MDNKKKGTLVMVIALAQLALAVAVMVIGALNKSMSNLQSNILMAGSLFVYWLLMDVVDAVVRHKLDHVTPEQKSAYYKYALFDFAGLAGIAVFLFGLGSGNSNSIIGAVIYAFTMKPKKDSLDVFSGKVKPEEPEEEPEEETEEWVTAATRKAELEAARTDESGEQAAGSEQETGTAQDAGGEQETGTVQDAGGEHETGTAQETDGEQA